MKQYKARDKITQKMTRDGAIEVNESKGTKKRISKRAREAALLKTPEQQAAQDAQAAQPVPGDRKSTRLNSSHSSQSRMPSSA